jgi:Fe-S cluster assembly protein SufD
MTLFSDFSSVQAALVKDLAGGPDAIKQMQLEARAMLPTLSLPTRRTESWKYSFRRVAGIEGFSLAENKQNEEPSLNSSFSYAEAIQATALPFINGVLSENAIAQANMLEGIAVERFSDLSESAANKLLAHAQEYDRGEFETLNRSLCSHAILITIAKNAKVEKPLLLQYIQHGEGLSLPRVFVQQESGSELQLIEDFISDNAANSAWVSHTDFVIGANARLTYYRMNLNAKQQSLTGTTRALLQRDAVLESHCLCLGAELGRHDFNVLLAEPGASCDLNGVCVTRNKEHFDNHTNIEHIAPHCTSNENYRCIADDASQIVFNGRIHIHRDAQKTLGSMSNKNLILSSQAEIDAKPELEIYADDVKCAHGTTIGQLNEKEVYYLKTRGLSDDQARQMLTLGFVLEIVRSAPITELADTWEACLANILSFKD